jgi:hypothetical protein
VACAWKMKVSFLSLATSDVVWLNGPPFQPKLELSCFNCDQEKGNQVVHSVNNCLLTAAPGSNVVCSIRADGSTFLLEKHGSTLND